MPLEMLSTSQVARAAGLHANTIRMYESWGYISPVPRAKNGYRRFSQTHLKQVKVIKAAHHFTWVMGEVRQAGLAMIECAANEDFAGAYAMAKQALENVQTERRQAEDAASYLERWARGLEPEPTQRPLKRTEVAQLLNTTIDALRNWERNRLIQVPRDPSNGYRRYGPAEIGRLRVIRILIRSRYSMMAILRMLTQLDQGQTEDLRHALDTPRPDEDIFYATDHWLTTLEEVERHASAAVELTATFVDKQD